MHILSLRRFCNLTVLLAGVLACCITARAEIGNITVTSAASFEVGLPAKGSLASVFLTGIEVEGIVAADSFPLPMVLEGVRVWVGGAPAPLLAVAGLQGFQQINIQVPQEAEFGAEDAEVMVEQNGQKGTARAPLRLSSPGDFFRFAGSNRAIFQHATDYSLVTAENPARPGEVIVAYLTGMPGTEPTVPTGEPSPFEPLAVVPQYLYDWGGEHYYITFYSGRWVIPLFVGLTPSIAGVYQINFVVPESEPGGDRQVGLLRTRCRAWHGSCIGGGGDTKYFQSSPVIIPVR